MKQILIVFIGGGMGSVIRFFIGKVLPYSGKGFPWNTFWTNLLGCLLIGIITGYFLRNSSETEENYTFLGVSWAQFENFVLYDVGLMM